MFNTTPNNAIINSTLSEANYFFQILNIEKLKRRDAFNGHAEVTFARGIEQGRFRQGLKLGKCFLLSDDNIREVRGNFEDNVLQVMFTCET